MTDPITDAVRRIKRLQQDVERLKSGTNERGVPRVLRQLTDDTAIDDTVETGPAAAVDDSIVATDSVTTGPDAAVDETTGVSDATSTTTAAVERAAWNEAAWDEDYWD